MKNEEENGSGEVEMSCELFSGERSSYKYATEKTRNIEENLSFVIIGCTQVPFAARFSSAEWTKVTACSIVSYSGFQRA